MEQQYQDKGYIKNTLLIAEDQFKELCSISVYNQDIQGKEINKLLQDFEKIKIQIECDLKI